MKKTSQKRIERKRRKIANRVARKLHPQYLRIQAANGAVEFAPAEGDGQRTCHMLAYSGGPLSIEGWEFPVVVDIGGMEVPNLPKIRLDHKPEQRVGHATNVTTDGNIVMVDGVISSTSKHAQEVVQDADNGYPWQSSIGAKPLGDESIEFVPEGRSFEANGQLHQGPAYYVTRSKLSEVSFVDVGGDLDATAIVANEPPLNAVAQEINSMTFDEWVNGKFGVPANDLSAEDREELLAVYNKDAELNSQEAKTEQLAQQAQQLADEIEKETPPVVETQSPEDITADFISDLQTAVAEAQGENEEIAAQTPEENPFMEDVLTVLDAQGISNEELDGLEVVSMGDDEMHAQESDAEDDIQGATDEELAQQIAQENAEYIDDESLAERIGDRLGIDGQEEEIEAQLTPEQRAEIEEKAKDHYRKRMGQGSLGLGMALPFMGEEGELPVEAQLTPMEMEEFFAQENGPSQEEIDQLEAVGQGEDEQMEAGFTGSPLEKAFMNTMAGVGALGTGAALGAAPLLLLNEDETDAVQSQEDEPAEQITAPCDTGEIEGQDFDDTGEPLLPKLARMAGLATLAAPAGALLALPALAQEGGDEQPVESADDQQEVEAVDPRFEFEDEMTFGTINPSQLGNIAKAIGGKIADRITGQANGEGEKVEATAKDVAKEVGQTMATLGATAGLVAGAMLLAEEGGGEEQIQALMERL